VRPTILVNNAGVGTNPDALDATEDEWNELLEVNLRGLFFETYRYAPGPPVRVSAIWQRTQPGTNTRP
jgi:NAD(P)-dependent dehydrogenase (short-subunit alcohol dehydrogenase family)